MSNKCLTGALLSSCVAVTSSGVAAGNSNACHDLPDHGDLQAELAGIVVGGGNGGLGNDMWATVVNTDGVVCAVVFSGADRFAQWEGSRAISAQKANSANAFSLDGVFPNLGVGRALASGNVYGLVQPGGSLFGLQFSNPVDTRVAYRGNAKHYGQPNDPMVGDKIGGVNVFGGGLALYDENGARVGAVGVSSDTACTDHIIAWKVRDGLSLDNIPGGVGDGFTNDNLIINDPPTPNSFEHPICGFGEELIITDLATNFPTGP